jgi:hypothetical protein
MIMQKNLPAPEVFSRIFIRFFIDFAALLHFMLKGEVKFAMAVSKAHFHFFKHLSATRKKRTAKQMPYKQHTGVLHASIVYSFFIKKIRKFSGIEFK